MARRRRLQPWLAVVLLLLAPVGARSEDADASRVRHWLPFPAGVSYKVWQGNDQGPTHNDEWNRYAWDFSPMDVGSDVCATADGVVVFVKEDATGPTGNYADNNEICLRHADGTYGVYAHLMENGALVDVGERVFGGDVIGKSGNTGSSSAPHLHFSLKSRDRLGPSIPCRFEDVPGDGVPKTNDLVTSRNVSGKPLRDLLAALETRLDEAVALDALVTVADEMKALLRSKPPAEFAAALEDLGDGDAFRDLFESGREQVLTRYRSLATERLAVLAEASESSDLETAVRLAVFGKEDFAPLEERKEFETALKELRQLPGYPAAASTVQARVSWRRDLVRALDLEQKTRLRAEEGRRVRWSAVVVMQERLIKRAPTEPIGAALSAHVEALRAHAAAAPD